MTDTLPLPLPKLLVKTLHSSYAIDQEAQTFARTTVADEANDLSAWGIIDGEWQDYAEARVQLDAPLVITFADGRWLRSTQVRSITELPA